MPFTNITKPNAGDAGRKSLIDAIIDDLLFLNSISSSLNSATLPNGSFELDSDADGIPDEWARTLFTNGSLTIDTSAGNFVHGVKAIKFVHPGGSGNGGGYVQSANYFEWSEKQTLVLQWSHKTSASGMLDKVDVLFYDSTQTLISTVNIYSSTLNPTGVWTPQSGAAVPPANTRYAKIKITGGDSSNTTGGSSWWDNIQIVPTQIFLEELYFSTPGSYSWTCPASPNCTMVWVEVVGPGGGGGAGNSGDGGGAGGYAQKWFTPTPGNTYAIVVGSGGAGGTGTGDGVAGSGASSFNATIIANAGGRGLGSGSGSSPGTGGTASGGDVNLPGGNGGARNGSTGGAGGRNGRLGGFAPAVTSAPGASGPIPGAGGAGGGGGNNAGAGANGQVILRFFP